ncbi:MAG: TIGR02300 family protein [Hyphomicrobium sp.]
MDRIQIPTIERLAWRGTKRTCMEADCGERFYDLNRTSIACPHCGAAFVPVPEVVVKLKASPKTRSYRIENPQPKLIEAQETDNEEGEDTEPSNADSLEDEVEDIGGETPLLGTEDADEDSAVVDRAKLNADD